MSTRTRTQVAPNEVDTMHRIVNEGIAAYCRSIALSGTPPTVERETIGWILSEFESWKLAHLMTIIACVGMKTGSYDACTRYALDRDDSSVLPRTEHALLDVLLDTLYEGGHGPEDAARLIDAMARPIEHTLGMAHNMPAPCSRCETDTLTAGSQGHRPDA